MVGVVITESKRKAFLEKSTFKRKIQTKKNCCLNIHLIASLLKRWLLDTLHGAVESQYLQSYLDEYVFRFNKRKSAQKGLLFYRVLESAMQSKTITYEELTDHKQYRSWPLYYRLHKEHLFLGRLRGLCGN
jgi:hypothetical protein